MGIEPPTLVKVGGAPSAPPNLLGYSPMAAVEAAFSIFSSSTLISPKSRFLLVRSSCLFPPRISTSIPTLSVKYPPHLHPLQTRKLGFKLRSAVEEITLEQTQDEEEEQHLEINLKKKLFVFNLPWSFSVADVKTLFGQCGIVADVEIIKRQNGKSRGYVFVTMASAEDAQAVIDKFDSQEVSGRIVRIEFAKRLKKPSPALSATVVAQGETRHKLYVSNIAWKVRSTHLRDFFESKFKPVSARVVFDSPSGKSAGYGFVSFSTKEEAEAAISDFNGKELFGRPISLKFSVTKDDESKKSEEGSLVEQPQE